MLIIHAGDSELVAVDCFECIDAQLDVREKLRHMVWFLTYNTPSRCALNVGQRPS